MNHNNMVHTSTGYTPSYHLYGESNSTIPSEFFIPFYLQEDKKVAEENSLKSHTTNAEYFNKNRKHWSFKKGIWLC